MFYLFEGGPEIILEDIFSYFPGNLWFGLNGKGRSHPYMSKYLKNGARSKKTQGSYHKLAWGDSLSWNDWFNKILRRSCWLHCLNPYSNQRWKKPGMFAMKTVTIRNDKKASGKICWTTKLVNIARGTTDPGYWLQGAFLAPQSGAHRIAPHRDFHPIPIPIPSHL